MEEDGFEELNRVLETTPLYAVYHTIAFSHFSNGRLKQALDAAERAEATAPPQDKIHIGVLAGFLQIAGGNSERVASLLGLLDGRVFGAPIALAIFHVICGELDQAAEWIAKSVEERYPATLFFINGSPLGDALRASPRWPALAKMMNLPEVG
jgi:hypothetical protein